MIKSLVLIMLILSGCANFSVNSTMCDQVGTQANSTTPQECQNYSEEKAKKAYFKEQKKHESQENIIKFTKDADDE